MDTVSPRTSDLTIKPLATVLPCSECGTELPARVYEAGEILNGNQRLQSYDLVESIRLQIKMERTDNRDRYRHIGHDAVEDWFDGPRYVDLIDAYQHYFGGACEAAANARWCHERGPGKDSPDSAVWAASLCDLEGNHAGPHSFEAPQ